MFHAHADYDDGGVDEDAADEEVMMERMICWKYLTQIWWLWGLLFLGMTSRAQLCHKNSIYSQISDLLVPSFDKLLI